MKNTNRIWQAKNDPYKSSYWLTDGFGITMWFWVVVAIFITPSIAILPEREIDGEAFCHLSRKDIATIFPTPKQFILASKLYKVVQPAHSSFDSSDTSHININEMLGDLDETLSRSSKLRASIISSESSHKKSRGSSSSPGSEASRKRSSMESTDDPQQKKKRHSDKSSSAVEECSAFKLPVFSPDIQNCISKDAFYLPKQTQRLIKESCVALRGYCWEHGNTLTNSDKKALAKKLYELYSYQDSRGTCDFFK